MNVGQLLEKRAGGLGSDIAGRVISDGVIGSFMGRTSPVGSIGELVGLFDKDLDSQKKRDALDWGPQDQEEQKES